MELFDVYPLYVITPVSALGSTIIDDAEKLAEFVPPRAEAGDIIRDD